MSEELKFKAQLFVIMILVLGVPIYLIYLEYKSKEKQKAEQKEFEDKLVSDIQITVKNNTTLQLSDVETLYLSIWSADLISLNSLQTIIRALRKSKRNIAVDAHPDSDKSKSYLVRINQLITETEQSILTESKKAPFVGVSDPERGLLEDVHEAAIGAEKEDYIFGKLQDLATSLNLRDSESKKYIDEQKESLKSSKRGLWATVVFSLVSIALTFYLSGKST